MSSAESPESPDTSLTMYSTPSATALGERFDESGATEMILSPSGSPSPNLASTSSAVRVRVSSRSKNSACPVDPTGSGGPNESFGCGLKPCVNTTGRPDSASDRSTARMTSR